VKHIDPQSLPENGAPPASHAVGGALAITAIVLVAITLRPGIVSVGPILPSIIDEFGLSHAAASLLTSIPDVLMGLLALPTPWLARRVGRDPVLLAALFLLCLSIAFRAFATGTVSLLASTAGVGAGIAVAGALMAGFIKARFPTKAALLMGIYATALSLGSTVSAAVTGPVAANGWRLASGMWSILGIFAIVAWTAVTLSERRHRTTVPVATATTKLPLRNKTAWLVALFFACDNFLFYAILSWTSPMYRELGLSSAVAGLVLASFTASFMLANPVLRQQVARPAWMARDLRRAFGRGIGRHRAGADARPIRVHSVERARPRRRVHPWHDAAAGQYAQRRGSQCLERVRAHRRLSDCFDRARAGRTPA
jgi:MFS transporter, CP family, cyanate transporter